MGNNMEKAWKNGRKAGQKLAKFPRNKPYYDFS
jgi:hypothetical protein